MIFLLIASLLFPTNASPCAQRNRPEQNRLIWVALRDKKTVIIGVNPEGEPSFTVFPEYGGKPIITMPEGWELLHLSNAIFNGQNYLVAEVQRIGGDRVTLRIMLPMVLTISYYGDNTNRVWGEREKIAEYIGKGIKKYEEEEERREIELVNYQKKEEIRETEAEKQRTRKEKQEKILALRKRIFSKSYFERVKEDVSCYSTYSVTKNGIDWEIWTCLIEEGSVRFFAVPAYGSKPFIHNRDQSVIEVKPEIKDGYPNKADLLKQIEEVKKAALL